MIGYHSYVISQQFMWPHDISHGNITNHCTLMTSYPSHDFIPFFPMIHKQIIWSHIYYMIRKMTILIIRGTCHHMPFMRAIACGHLAKARAQPFAAPHDGSTASLPRAGQLSHLHGRTHPAAFYGMQQNLCNKLVTLVARG